MVRTSLRLRRIALLLACVWGLNPAAGWALPRTWVGGNNDWIDHGSTANWDPADEPDDDDTAIFNTANSVNLGSNNAVNGLTMSGGIELATNGHNLSVDGLAALSGNARLLIGGNTSVLDADGVTINGGGTIELAGGTLTVDGEQLVGGGSLSIINGTLEGNGTVDFSDSPLSPVTIFNNRGTLTALSRPENISSPPPAGTLAINGGTNARIDLDGGPEEGGIVNVHRNQTLDINIALADSFSGAINLFHSATLDIAGPWTLGGGTVDIDNGAAAGIPPISAGISTIAGGTLTQTGGVITVLDNDGTLRFTAPFTMNDGTFTNNGHVIFDADATVAAAASFMMATNTSSITVDAGRTVTINQPNFNADGGGQTTNILAVNSGGVLSLNLGAGADDSLSGLIQLNGGTLDVSTANDNWSIGGTVQVGANTGNSQIGGETLTMINVNATIGEDSTLHIAAPLMLAANANFNGTGTLAFNNQAAVTAPTTINMTGGAVDLDGTDAVGDTISIRAPLVINATDMESFGRVNAGGGVNTIQVDAVSVGATGRLTVNLDDPDPEWTLNAGGVLALSNTNSLATLLAGADVNLNGTVNVLGAVGSTARINFGGVINLLSGSGGFVFQGGTLDDPNRIENGLVTGVGKLQAAVGRALVGRGTINSPIDFDGTSQLVADSGSLILNGIVEDIGTLGTNGESAVLDLQLPFNTNVTEGGIVMAGGTLQGAAITTATVDQSIRGRGTVTNVVVNDGAVEAQLGTLLFNNAESDWDGAANNGQLRASAAAMLEIHDDSHVTFGGLVHAEGESIISINGFDMAYGPTSTITLNGSTYKSTNTTHIHGAVQIGAGPESTIEVEVNRFLDFGATSVATLDGNLRLVNNNVNVEMGATFSGNGALVVANDSNLIVDAGAEIDVLVENRGNFFPGSIMNVGRVDLKDYQQSATGELSVEVSGTGLNDFDRIVVDGGVLLDGELSVAFMGGFVAALGNTFDIISAASVSGSFNVVNAPGLPAGLSLHVNYQPTLVQLAVIGVLPGDYNQSGAVDAADYVVWRNTLGNPVSPSSGADGNGNGMIDNADYDVWRANFGATSFNLNASALAAIPEPTSVLLLIIGTLATVRMRLAIPTFSA